MTTEDPTDASTHLGGAAPTQALHVPTRTIVLVGMGLWAVGLVVTLAAPSLHAGERSWWPWTCVAGLALGAFALWYVSRNGRGDAAGT